MCMIRLKRVRRVLWQTASFTQKNIDTCWAKLQSYNSGDIWIVQETLRRLKSSSSTVLADPSSDGFRTTINMFIVKGKWNLSLLLTCWDLPINEFSSMPRKWNTRLLWQRSHSSCCKLAVSSLPSGSRCFQFIWTSRFLNKLRQGERPS